MPLIKAKSDVKKRQQKKEQEALLVSEEAQNRLAEILADSPSIEKLAGTEWEMRALRSGTEYLIVDEVCKINKAENATYGDVLKCMLAQIPATCKVITLALLNDKYLIYEDGEKSKGFSELFKRTYETVLWESEKAELANIMLDCLMMIDVSFFMKALGMLQIFRASVTEKKRTRKKIPELK